MTRQRTFFLGVLALGAGMACAGILGIRPPERRVFEHRDHVLKGINCVRCHPGVEKAGEESDLHIPGTAECMTCHPKPHDRRECANCHGLAFARENVVLARRHLRFTHEKHMPRVRGNCVRCHSEVARDGQALRPTMGACLGCHEHRDQFATRDCSACHVDLPTEGVRPANHLVHDGDFLREHGVRAAAAQDLCATCHTERFCAGCHGVSTPGLPEMLAFDQPLATGVHRAGFRSRHSDEARQGSGLCSTCHSPGSCRDCHSREGVSAVSAEASSPDDRRSPHSQGWLGLPGQANEHGRAALRDPIVCASCHGGAGEVLCIGCHRVGAVGGSPHGPSWSSNQSKREAVCRPCHEMEAP